MKKYLNISFLYAILAMVGGVFYREFTKLNGFTGSTTLSVVHTHLFLLGMVMFLLVALFSKGSELNRTKPFGAFMVVYNVGVALSTIMFLVRGIPQVLGMELSKGMDAAISGMAGLGHIFTGVGMVLFFLALRKAADREKAIV